MDLQDQKDADASVISPNQARAVDPVEPDTDGKLAEKELEFWHAQETQKAHHGWLGKIFGSIQEKPGNIAAIAVILSFIMLFVAFGVMYRGAGDLNENFFKLLSALTGVIGLALGYLFGSSGQK
ncbi:MAG: hypothetical protein LBE59_02065 [Nevskiaceae bacterium]|nr:hypothetical protein [Nevskiaceae bacterium]